MADSDRPYPGDCEFTEFLLKKSAARNSESVGCSRDECLALAKAVRILLLDVDGVLTDGSISYTHNGEEIKTFHCRDGFGINMLRKIGVEVGLITARRSKALTRRCKDLSLVHVYQGARNKVEVFRKIIEEIGLEPSEVAFMGDDWLDLPLLTRVGLAAAVADGACEVRNIAHFVAPNRGGRGAVRDLCDLIIEAKGCRQQLLTEYMDRQ